MINWKDPNKEMPPSGSHVWVLIKHWKQDNLLSCEIFGAEVWETSKKEQYFANNDDIGGGSMTWSLGQITAWADKESINLPDL